MPSIWKIKGLYPYIIVVFLNAFTDLGHKIIIQNTVFKVHDGQTQIILTAIVNALILLPLLYSAGPVLMNLFRLDNTGQARCRKYWVCRIYDQIV